MIEASICSPPTPGGPKGLWYLAHPYTGDERANFDDSVRVFGACMKRGYGVFNPIGHSHAPSGVYPEMAERRGVDVWLELDMLIILRTQWDGLILCPGWEESRGCRAERRAFCELQQCASLAGEPVPRIIELAEALAEPVDPRFEEAT